ncbi:MAG: sensor histidine kinase [Salibacteraceae bacterium]
MSAKTIRIILLLMLATIGGLFITQAYWFKKSFSVHQKQLDDQINIALRSVGHQILIQQNDSTSQIPSVSKLSANEYFVELNTYFSLRTLDSLLILEFYNRNMELDYDYLIVKEQNKEVILGNRNYHKMLSYLEFDSSKACATRWELEEKRNFKVRINNKTGHVLSAMGIWMFSSGTLLFILAVFTFIIVSIIKGKRLSLLKKDFVNNMTHELKTPIANISVASDAIRNDKIQMDESKLKKYADIIYKENHRLHQLVDRVLQISEIEKYDQTLNKEWVNVNELVVEIIRNFEPVIHSNSGQIKSNLGKENPNIKADRLHLSNVINNLIENGIKYSIESPDIEVSTSVSGRQFVISVSDKGVGISVGDSDRVFEKFYRAETGNVHNTKGYGLGLSYVKLIAEKHGGSISFTSKKGKGSTFILKLPL